MLRVIKEVQPKWVIGENVRGLVSWNDGMVFHEVYADLESEGYEVQSFLIPAAGVNAPHQRFRVWFVAYAHDKGRSSESKNISKENGEVSQWNDDAQPSNTDHINASDANQIGLSTEMENGKLARQFRPTKRDERNAWHSFPTQPTLCGGDDGLPKELDNITLPKWRKESIMAYGNAIVPQVAHTIFKAVEAFENI